MALSDPYVSVDDFKARLNITGTAQDAVIEQTILAASQWIDSVCGQTFNKSDTATAKYVTARYPDVIETPPLVSISELATDTGARTYLTIWATTDYDLYPYDAADAGRPYTEIRRSPLGVYAWPSHVRGVRITGIWGWPSVPAPIVQATMREAERLWALSRAPLGLAGSGELQSPISRGDADVKALLSAFRVVTV
jgi:hypothetical protein